MRFYIDGHVYDRTVCLDRKYFTSKEYAVRKLDYKLIDIADRILLKDCTLDPFVINEASLSNNWTKAIYQDGDAGYWFPLVDYGKFAGDNGVISTEIGDYRAWFSPLKLLKDGFCKLGWEFESPILESTFGRRQWRYLSHTNVVKDSVITNNSLSTFSLGTNQPVTSNNSIDFDTYTFDSAGFANVNFIYQYTNFTSAPLTACIHLEGDFNVLAGGTDGVFKIRVLKTKDNNPALTQVETIYETNSTGLKTIDIRTTTTIEGGYTYTFQVVGNANFQAGFGGSNKILAKDRYTTGSELQLNYAINPELSLLDLLKAEMHLYNCVLDVDLENKKIAMHIPETTEVFGETIEGYYQTPHLAEDFPFDMECDTLEIFYGCGFQTADQQCFKFKDSTDDYLTAKYKEVQVEVCGEDVETGSIEKELFQYCEYLDLQDIKKDTKENHLYEPTLNDQPSASIWINRTRPGIPKLFDNVDGELSLDIGYRAVIGFYTPVLNTDNGQTATFRLNTTTVSTIPLAFQNYRYSIQFFDYQNENLTFDKEGDNLFNLFYKNETLGLEKKTTYSASFIMKASDAVNLNRRKDYFLNIEGKPIQARVLNYSWQEGKANINFKEIEC